MGLLALEHSKTVYWADFVLYGSAVGGLAAALLFCSPPGQGAELGLLAFAGLAGWTLIEYLLHRYVLHGLQPFRRWHAEHHKRPSALIASPTLFSAALLLGLVFLPAWLAFGGWGGSALSFGVVTGYLGYTVTHHATHHWNFDNAWLKRRKRAHALHHHLDQPVGYGVTSAFWDQVFGTAPRRAGGPGTGGAARRVGGLEAGAGPSADSSPGSSVAANPGAAETARRGVPKRPQATST